LVLNGHDALACIPASLSQPVTLPLLSAQGKQEIKLFVGDGGGVRWEVNALHQFSDPALGIVIDAGSF